jgi:sigma54-dependent transcription regulator
MKMLRFALLLVALLALSCQREQRLHTERTAGLVKELLTKLDSADVYAARKEAEIEILKLSLRDAYTYREKYDILYDVANLYAHHTLDSSLVYLEKAADVLRQARDERLMMSVDIRRSTMLTIGGFYMAAAEILNSLPRKELL